jgi:ornithine cyclodeaminase/alanine dehydrogenase-like protein (mu-crystallin family)
VTIGGVDSKVDLPWLDRAAVERLASPAVARAAVRRAMLALSAGDVEMPQRSVIPAPSAGAATLIKPARLIVDDQIWFGIKVVSVYPDNVLRGEPTIQGVVVMIESTTGRPLAVLDGAAVTELRTAAASALATEAMSRPDAHVLALVGAGAQARAHLRALREIRDFDDIRVCSRRRGSAEILAGWAARRGWRVRVCDGVAEAVRGADVVCTLTSSPDPVLRTAWLADGTHVNAVGAFTPRTRELDAKVIADALVIVDQQRAAITEAGDILLAVADGATTLDCIAGELGALLAGRIWLERTRSRITVFKSLGLAVQDVALAAAVLTEPTGDNAGPPRSP